MTLMIRFIGAFRHYSKVKQLTLDFQPSLTVKGVIDQINLKIPQLKPTFCDQELNDARANSLIMVNGKEISVLDGYETQLFDGDEVVFVPIIHGG